MIKEAIDKVQALTDAARKPYVMQVPGKHSLAVWMVDNAGGESRTCRLCV